MAVKFLINILEMTWEIKMKGFPKRKDIHKVLPVNLQQKRENCCLDHYKEEVKGAEYKEEIQVLKFPQ